jgi:hypothetical protein
MARFALIDPITHETERVIVATPAFIAANPPIARGRRLADFELVRVAYPGEADALEADVITRDCAVGSGWDPDAVSFVRGEPGKRWDRNLRRMVDDASRVVPKTAAELLEERIAALEAARESR